MSDTNQTIEDKISRMRLMGLCGFEGRLNSKQMIELADAYDAVVKMERLGMRAIKTSRRLLRTLYVSYALNVLLWVALMWEWLG